MHEGDITSLDNLSALEIEDRLARCKGLQLLPQRGVTFFQLAALVEKDGLRIADPLAPNLYPPRSCTP